jgi:hypothetical protein
LKTEKNGVLVVVVADLHVNSKVALCPPEVKCAGGGTYIPSRQVQWIWEECWLDVWREVEKRKRKDKVPVLGLFLGDDVDLNQHTHSELIETNDEEIVAMGELALQPARKVCDRLILLRGTEAHVGQLGKLEEALARRVKADPSPSGTASWWHWLGEPGGVLIDASHHAQTHGHMPHTRDAAASRQALITWMEYTDSEEKPPQIVVRGHSHFVGHGFKSGGNHEVECWFLPSWQLTTAFGHRRGSGRKVEPIRALLLQCQEGRYTHEWLMYRAKPAPIWKM